MEFSDWLDNTEIYEKIKYIFEAKEDFFQKGNVLIPYGDWDEEGNLPGASKFARDNPAIRAYVKQSPDNMASMLIFVFMSIQANFQEMLAVFPIVMAKLHTKWANKNEKNKLDPAQYEKELHRMQNKVQSILNVDPGWSDAKKLSFQQPWNIVTMSSIFSWKKDAIAQAWSRRDTIFSNATRFIDSNDTVGLFEWFQKNVKGLGAPKSGFCVQLCMGKLGCIDVHNINLYSAWAAKKQGKRSALYKRLNPQGDIKRSDAKGLKNYLMILDLLSKNGIESQQLWDIWVQYVAFNYVSDKGVPAYDTTNKFASASVGLDPQTKKTPWGFEDLGDIPNRSRPDDPTIYRWGSSPGAGTASRMHRIIGNVRNIKFWNDVLRAAQAGGAKAPDEVRYKDPLYIKQKGDLPHRLLAYLVAEPQLAKDLGLNNEFLGKALDVLREKGYLKPTTKSILAP